MRTSNLDLPRDRIAALCRKWQIVELSLFGSVLREDFGPESDVDVLVEFDASARVSSFDLLDVRDELADLIGRPVDILTRRSVERSSNAWKRAAILGHAHRVYAA